MLQRKYMEKNRSIARTVSIEAVLQPRFHYAKFLKLSRKMFIKLVNFGQQL